MFENNYGNEGVREEVVEEVVVKPKKKSKEELLKGKMTAAKEKLAAEQAALKAKLAEQEAKLKESLKREEEAIRKALRVEEENSNRKIARAVRKFWASNNDFSELETEIEDILGGRE